MLISSNTTIKGWRWGKFNIKKYHILYVRFMKKCIMPISVGGKITLPSELGIKSGDRLIWEPIAGSGTLKCRVYVIPKGSRRDKDFLVVKELKQKYLK